MARFRETLWFKKGNEAAVEAKDDGSDAERPIEDAYQDDGSITMIDHAAYSVATGLTQPITTFVGMQQPAVDDKQAEQTMKFVVGQMKRGRGKVVAMIGASMACIAFVVATFVA